VHPHLDAVKERIRARRRQARFLLRRLPRRSNAHRFPVVGRLIHRILLPQFWMWKGWPFRAALYAGFCLSFLPLIGFQIPLAVGLAFLLRLNLPTIVGLQLLSNPLTAAPLYGLTFATGWFPIELLDLELRTATGITLSLVLGGLFWGCVTAAAFDIAVSLRRRAHARDLLLLRQAHTSFDADEIAPFTARLG